MGRESRVRGKEKAKGEGGWGQGREGSTWIFVQGPRVPSYATALPSSLYYISILC